MNNSISKNVFEEFCNSIYEEDQKRISYIVLKCNKAREKRLKKHGLTVEETIQIKKGSEKLYYSSSNEQTFKNEIYSVENIKKSKYYKNNNLLDEISNENILYVNVTSINDENRIYHHNYNCPNCGTLLTVKTLLDGCTHCKTKFIVSDMYPIVSNYFNIELKDSFIIKERYTEPDNKKIRKRIIGLLINSLVSTIICTVVIHFLAPLMDFGLNFDDKAFYIIFDFVAFLFLFIIFFMIYGIKYYMASYEYYKVKTKREDSKGDLLYNETPKIEAFMKRYDANFSFNLFQSKILSMFKEIIFSEDNNKKFNPVSLINFSNIVESNYNGGLEINEFFEESGYIYIKISLYTIDTIIKGGKIVNIRNKYGVRVCRKSDVVTTSDFRIQGINCKNCGSPIDFEKDNHCNHCNSSYKLEDYEYIFTNIELENSFIENLKNDFPELNTVQYEVNKYNDVLSKKNVGRF